MKAKELIGWITQEKLEEADLLVNGKDGYEEVAMLWESERGEHNSVILETVKPEREE